MCRAPGIKRRSRYIGFPKASGSRRRPLLPIYDNPFSVARGEKRTSACRSSASSSARPADWQDPSAMGGLEEIKNEAVDLVRNNRCRYC